MKKFLLPPILFLSTISAQAGVVDFLLRPEANTPYFGVQSSAGTLLLSSETASHARIISGSQLTNATSLENAIDAASFLSDGANLVTENAPGFFEAQASSIDADSLGIVGQQPYVLILVGLNASDELDLSQITEYALFTDSSWGTIPDPGLFSAIYFGETTDPDIVLAGVETTVNGVSRIETVSINVAPQDPTDSPQVPTEDRPALDNFPDAEPLDGSGSSGGDNSDSSLDGWVVDPVYELIYLDDDTDWIFSQTFGWAYSSPASDGGNWFFVDDTERWYWSNASTYPYVFDDLANAFVYLHEENGVRFLYDFALNRWQQISD